MVLCRSSQVFPLFLPRPYKWPVPLPVDCGELAKRSLVRPNSSMIQDFRWVSPRPLSLVGFRRRPPPPKWKYLREVRDVRLLALRCLGGFAEDFFFSFPPLSTFASIDKSVFSFPLTLLSNMKHEYVTVVNQRVSIPHFSSFPPTPLCCFFFPFLLFFKQYISCCLYSFYFFSACTLHLGL